MSLQKLKKNLFLLLLSNSNSLEIQDQQISSLIEKFHIEYDIMDKHQYFLRHSKQNFHIRKQRNILLQKSTLAL